MQEWITWGAAGVNVTWTVFWMWTSSRLRRRQKREMEWERCVHRYQVTADVLREAEERTKRVVERQVLSHARTLIAFGELEERIGHLVIDPNTKMQYPPS